MRSRREFLKAAMVTTGFGLGLNPVMAKASQKDLREVKADEKTVAEMPHRIDVHHHIFPPQYVKAAFDVGAKDMMGLLKTLPPWSAEKAIEMMDRYGIQKGVTHHSIAVANIGDIKAARNLARACNETAAKVISDHPQRFGAFAVMPLPDIEGTLDEIEYALDTLKLDGIGLLTNYNGKYLGDPLFERVYRNLNRRKAVVHVHPSNAPGNPFNIPSSLMEYTFETTRTIFNLIYRGTVDRYPDISFIFSHGGGTIPYLANRIGDARFIWHGEAAKNAPKGFYFYLKRLYYDTAIIGPYALPSFHALVNTSHILFGTDHPLVPEPDVIANIKSLAAFKEFDVGGRRAIEQENALKLLSR